ncbi:MAG: polysaccharide biosynthesis C-terminal domain-containing protein [Firmicutes bacterium]|nr:polysaccharide biosynthesis C-terminal domain-containing protein [Bacillota bacterium]
MLDKKKFAKSVGILSNVTFLNVLFSFFNSLLIAYYFGVSRELEIYFAALTLFQLAQKLSHSGIISEVFIPYFVKYADTPFYYKYANSLISIFILIGILLIIMLIFLAKPLMSFLIPGFSTEDISNSTVIYIYVLPLLPIVIVNSIFDAILQARKRFGITEGGILVSQIIGLCLFLLLVGSLNIYALLISFMCAPIVRIVFVSTQIRDVIKNFRFELNLKDEEVTSSLFKITPFIGYTFITQGVIFFTTSIVSFLPQGSLAILKYSQNIFDKMSRITTGPIVTVAYVELSEAINSSLEKFARLFKSVYSYALPVSLIVISLILLGNEELLSIIFVRGKFSQGDANILYYCLLVQSFSLPFAIYSVMSRKSFISVHKTTLANIFMILHQVIYIALVYFLAERWGIIGVLLSTSFTYFFMTFIYYLMQRKIFAFKYSWNEIKKILSIVAIIILGIMPIIIFRFIINEYFLLKEPVYLTAVAIFLYYLMFLSFTILLSKIFHVEEIYKLYLSVKELFQRLLSLKIKFNTK